MPVGEGVFMDDLLREFVTETNESLDVVDVELVRFEQDPNNAKILDNIFRLVHTIKGTCGFLGLPRLEALAHAAETLMGKFRDGAPASSEAVTLILATIDRIKTILESLEWSSGLGRPERVWRPRIPSEHWFRRCWNVLYGQTRTRSMISNARFVKQCLTGRR
jgi:chemotaxis protein histidine kinase CheA